MKVKAQNTPDGMRLAGQGVDMISDDQNLKEGDIVDMNDYKPVWQYINHCACLPPTPFFQDCPDPVNGIKDDVFNFKTRQILRSKKDVISMLQEKLQKKIAELRVHTESLNKTIMEIRDEISNLSN